MTDEEWTVFELKCIREDLLDVRPCVVARRTNIDLQDIMDIRNGTVSDPDFFNIRILDIYLMRNAEL